MSVTHVPAWKRLGLKLKYANESTNKNLSERQSKQTSEPYDIAQGSQKSSRTDAEPSSKRRRTEARIDSNRTSHGNHHSRQSKAATNGSENPSSIRDDSDNLRNAELEKRKKRVSFSADTKIIEGDLVLNGSITPLNSVPTNTKNKDPAAGKKQKRVGNRAKPATSTKFKVILDYLNQFHYERPDWKFRKNRESWILKHALSTNDIPNEYNLPLAHYIGSSQSQGGMTRLANQCHEALAVSTENKDEDGGSEGLERTNEDYKKKFLDWLEMAKKDQKLNKEDEDILRPWVIRQDRAQLLLWSIDPAAKSAIDNRKTKVPPNPENASSATKSRRQPKTRTSTITYSSSSSSSSDNSEESSDSSSDEDAEQTRPNGSLNQQQRSIGKAESDDEATSSSGAESSNDSSSSSSESTTTSSSKPQNSTSKLQKGKRSNNASHGEEKVNLDTSDESSSEDSDSSDSD